MPWTAFQPLSRDHEYRSLLKTPRRREPEESPLVQGEIAEEVGLSYGTGYRLTRRVAIVPLAAPKENLGLIPGAKSMD